MPHQSSPPPSTRTAPAHGTSEPKRKPRGHQALLASNRLQATPLTLFSSKPWERKNLSKHTSFCSPGPRTSPRLSPCFLTSCFRPASDAACRLLRLSILPAYLANVSPGWYRGVAGMVVQARGASGLLLMCSTRQAESTKPPARSLAQDESTIRFFFLLCNFFVSLIFSEPCQTAVPLKCECTRES